MRKIISDIQTKKPVRGYEDAVTSKRPAFDHMPEHFEPLRKEDFEHGARKGVWIVVGLVLCAFFVACASYFARATVTLSPRINHVPFDTTLTATTEKNSGKLSYELMSLSGSETGSLLSTNSLDKKTKAIGVAVLYNATNSVFRVGSGTVLEAPTGKRYLTKGAVTIPKAIKSGKTLIPGSISVPIEGAQIGIEYNSDPTDLVFVSLANTAKAKDIYARTKTALTGGYQGVVYVPDPAQIATLRTELSTKLTDKLFRQAQAQIPQHILIYKDATFFYGDPQETLVQDSPNILVTVSGSMTLVLLREDDFTRAIAKAVLSQYGGETVFIPTIKDIPVSIVNKETLTDLKAQTELSFLLAGEGDIVTKIDIATFKNELPELRGKEFQRIVKQFPEIDTATYKIFPFWKRHFPESLEKIKVINTFPEKTIDL